MKNYTISICIPTYNGEKYLRECIETCLNQSFPALEILIVDDGSTDTSLEIIKHYQQLDSRIQLHCNEKNLGLVGNWNRCVDLAQGEWIKFVFQDDYLRKDCLEKFTRTITETAQLLVSKRSFILPSNADSKLKSYYFSEVRTLESTRAESSGTFISAAEISRLAVENICLNFIGEPSLTLYRKSVVKELGSFNSDLAQICDLEYFQRIGTVYGLHYIPEAICHFRIHSDSTTSHNLGTKSYVLSHLDPILLVHQMLYDKSYACFRSAISRMQLFKLKTYFSLRSYEAFIYSEKTLENKIAFNKTSFKFEALKKAEQPGIFIILSYWLLRLKRILKR